MKVLVINPIMYTSETKNIKRAASIKDTMMYDFCLAFHEMGHSVTLVGGEPFKPTKSETYDILTMIKNNPIRILFGNGVNYLFKINYAHFGNPLWAHNDFIQIFSDYGLFGLLVYLGMFITLFKKTFNGIRISKMAMMMLVAIWAFNAFFNMFYTYFCATLSYPFYCMIIKIDAIKRGGGNPKQMD